MWSYMQNYIADIECLGFIDLKFLIFYGISMNQQNIFYTKLEQLFTYADLKGSLFYGVLSSGVTMFITLFYFPQIMSKRTFLFKYYIITIILMMINGVAQYFCSSSCTNIMGNWFKNNNIGLVMGIWIGCTNFGSILSLFRGDLIVQRLKLSPCYGFLILGSLLILFAIVIKNYLQPEPLQNNLEIELIEINSYCRSRQKVQFLVDQVHSMDSLLGFHSNFKTKSQSEKASRRFIGIFGDIIKNRSTFLISKALSIIRMIGIIRNESLQLYYLFLMLGFFHGGPQNNLSGAITIELVNTAISTVSSSIESIGSLTAASFQLSINQSYLYFFYLCYVENYNYFLFQKQI